MDIRARRPSGLSLHPSRSITRDVSHSAYDEDLSSDIAPGDWKLKPDVVAYSQRGARSGFPRRELGVTWTDLTVQATGSDAAVHENVASQFNIFQRVTQSRRKSELKTILKGSSGCVRPGETLLVLGRPGSGCTTLLSVLANRRKGYASISGSVHYGSMDALSASAKRHRGQIVMNTEEELFFPTLTVQQTMDFAARLKCTTTLPDGVESRQTGRAEMTEFLLQSMGIEHTATTKVGNEFVRGVSGGERKRVSIIEALATKGSVMCWDNSTRGLDASTALEYAKAVRAITDVLGISSIVTLYQAGNGIYKLFDKTLVLEAGEQLYYGPTSSARSFMESLGFICQEGANVADFLTGVTVPTERRIRAECEKTFPRNGRAIREAYENSDIFTKMSGEAEYHTTDAAKERTELFQKGVDIERDDHLPKNSPFTVSLLAQIDACIRRQYQIIWGAKATIIIKQVVNIVQAFVAGSLFYNAPDDSSGLFLKGGACFLSVLFNALMAMSEVTASFQGRPVLIKHKHFAFFHPAAYCLAQIAADVPIVLGQISAFSLILYFLVGLDMSAEAFFTFWAILVATTMCMTALFRAIGAGFSTFDGASKLSGFIILSTSMYAGYMIPKPDMHPWFVWIFWINPLAYGLEALLANEFHGKIIACVGNNLIPSGPGFESQYQSCAGVGGAVPGAVEVTGDAYLESLSYNYGNVWRNFGILWAFWVLFVVITVVATTAWSAPSDNAPTQVIPREKAKTAMPRRHDEEAQNEKTPNSQGQSSEATSETQVEGLVRNTSVFTWKNLTYTVKTPTGDRVLLDNVQGWVKPGMLGALMGSSGAGKTTLLDVLAQRKTEGTITGSVLVDGRPLPVSFQRSAGYCEQLDVHEPYATVREALEFSALLRQGREIPKEEKLAYVDAIVDLLELHELEDTLVGGLSVEKRKRVTIGVELVSRPSILIFLDEPTSGLDGQAAYNTVRFLRKLAAVGQAVLVTIHQPSAQLFAQFDTLLLLTRGGKTVYFGDVGDQAETLRGYFANNGAPCPAGVNPAEHMIDVVSDTSKDWNDIWLSSPEHAAATTELDKIVSDAAGRPPGTTDDGHEFALPLWSQIVLVTQRMNVSLYRNKDYLNNRFILHIMSALFNGFSFYQLGSSASELQLWMFTLFVFTFVAPGVIAQVQPLFIHRRDIFEAREKKSKMYSWVAFVTGLIVSEIPYLVICAVLYFVCWCYTVGLPTDSSRAGGIFFVMLMYEFLYTGMGQFVAAYAPNEVFASLINPLLIGTLISFCGVLTPYSQIPEFWRYWIYYLNPFNYLLGSLLVFGLWGRDVECASEEFAMFDPPQGVACGEYLQEYLAVAPGNLVNPEAESQCRVCPYTTGQDYLSGLNLEEYYYGWRDAAIVALFVFSSYALVFLLMKLRTKTSKTAQ